MDEIIKVKSKSGYSKHYIENIFWLWYGLGRISFKDLVLRIKPDKSNHKPTYLTITNWAKDNEWEVLADGLDEEARDRTAQKYVTEKALMLTKHAETGREIQEKGLQAFRDMKINSPHAALRAIELGIEIERESVNIEKLMETVSSMDDAKLMKKVNDYFPKVNLKPDAEDELQEDS